MTKAKFSKILAWLTAALVLLVAAALIICCIQINRSGSRPFTREAIAFYAGSVAVLGYICLAAVLTGLLIPGDDPQAKAIRDEKALLKRYQADLPAAKKEQQLRRCCRIVTTVLSALLAVYPVVYFCDLSHFSISDLTGDIIKALLIALIPAAISLTLIYLCGRIEARSISRQIAAYRESGIKPGKAQITERTNSKRLLTIRCVILACAALFIILGITNGGAADVLGKAIRICTECIGLG